MFCNKTNVNILTSSLLAYGIEDAVVCPGSRNAVVVHNLHALSANATDKAPFRIHPVTDERSAAFVAIGLWLATRRPVAVCVTSGSALLNLLPGVSEAYYRNIPLILISADRPARWIGQLDGQTLPQPNALLPYAKCWDIPDDADESVVRARCHEAMLAAHEEGGRPVHVNVPLDEPLFGFTTPTLPIVRPNALPEKATATLPSDVLEHICNARRPAIIVGEYESDTIPAIRVLQQQGWIVFAENISNQGIFCDSVEIAEGQVPEGKTESGDDAAIDLLIHIGGALVEKRLKLHLRQMPNLYIVRIDATNECPATFGHVDAKVKGDPADVLAVIADEVSAHIDPKVPVRQCSPAVLRHLPIEALFLGNSTSVRWANQHFRVSAPTYCNRGTNGIEGSLSVAAGYSLLAKGLTLCIMGDLSFFYDCNALWNRCLSGSLRILLVNNSCGGIFHRLPGLTESPALTDCVAAAHDNDARGIAESYKCLYLKEKSTDFTTDADSLIRRLLSIQSDRPVILEVFT